MSTSQHPQNRMSCLRGIAIFFLALLFIGMTSGRAWSKDRTLASLDQDAVITLKKSTTLNEIARALYPSDRVARDMYRERLARSNTTLFAQAVQIGSMPLPANTRLIFPAGTVLPPSQFVASAAATQSSPTGGGVPGTPQPAAGRVPQVSQATLPPPGGEINSLTRSAVEYGVLNCASRINQVSNFVGFSPQAGAILMMSGAPVDQRMLPLAIEIPTPNGAAYVSASFAPNQANGCGAAYDAVAYWAFKCETVASRQFSELKRVGMLKKEIIVLDGGSALKVFLMPAGSGCVSIKKEAIL